MTKQHQFNGTPEQVAIFRTECSRLRIKTVLKGTEDEPFVIALGLTDKQLESIINLSTSIVHTDEEE